MIYSESAMIYNRPCWTYAEIYQQCITAERNITETEKEQRRINKKALEAATMEQIENLKQYENDYYRQEHLTTMIYESNAEYLSDNCNRLLDKVSQCIARVVCPVDLANAIQCGPRESSIDGRCIKEYYRIDQCVSKYLLDELKLF